MELTNISVTGTQYEFYIEEAEFPYAYKIEGKAMVVNNKRKALEIIEKEMDRLKKELLKVMKIQFQIMEHEDKA